MGDVLEDVVAIGRKVVLAILILLRNLEYQLKEEQDGQEVAIKAFMGVVELMEAQVEETDKNVTNTKIIHIHNKTEEVGNKHLYQIIYKVLLTYKPEGLEVEVNGKGGGWKWLSD